MWTVPRQWSAGSSILASIIQCMLLASPSKAHWRFIAVFDCWRVVSQNFNVFFLSTLLAGWQHGLYIATSFQVSHLLPPFCDPVHPSLLGSHAVACLMFCLPCLRRPCNSTLHLPWVNFKVAVMAFRVQHGLAPAYLNDLVHVADLPGHHRLRSSSSHQLLVPPFRLTTVGRCTFPLLLWNLLPFDIHHPHLCPSSVSVLKHS